MQKFKLVTEELAESLKTLKKERTDELKEIKQLYQELEVKQKSPFEQTVERIAKNLAFYKDSEYKSANAGINSGEIVQKYDSKMKKINE